MGLDMYLSKRHYVKRWDHMKPEELHTVIVSKGDEVVTTIKPERVSHVIEEVAYWRKANQIHQWFVTHVQNGEDDCGEYDVGRNQLEELLRACVAVLKSPDEAASLLPTQSGFFFGGTEYDQYYFADLKETVKTLTALLAEAENGGWFTYHSSW